VRGAEFSAVERGEKMVVMCSLSLQRQIAHEFAFISVHREHLSRVKNAMRELTAGEDFDEISYGASGLRPWRFAPKPDPGTYN
jgi:hypothetical protein